MWRDAWLIAKKDMAIEARSRVALWQVLPFALLVLILAAFALGPAQSTLRSAAPGLFWLSVLFCSVLATQRSVAIESGQGARDGLRMSGVDPGGIFLGKAGAVTLQLVVLQIALFFGLVIFFGVHVHIIWLAALASLLGAIGIACAGALYGALSQGMYVRETLLPLLILPILAPVLLSGSRMWAAAISGQMSLGLLWLRVLLPFAVVYLVLGTVFYGSLLEAG